MPTVGSIMTSDLLSVSPAATLAEAAREMHERRVGAVVVLDGERLIGILTERDILRAVATDNLGGAVRDSMTHAPDTVEATDTTGHAAALMIHGGFRHLPVVEGDSVIGIISIRDLMRVQLDDVSPRGA